DLKSANIFITNQGEVKVLDFGVAQLRDAAGEMTATGTALGTPAYMSPEQAMGLVDQLDGRTDLFSVGAMIHALATGKRINHGRTENEALIMAATTPVPSVAKIASDLPIDVITVIDRSLAWDRRNRFNDATEMQNAVLAALQALASGVVARPEAATSRPMAMPTPTIPAPARGASIRPSTSLPPIINIPVTLTNQTGEVTAAENDPRVVSLRDLFKQVDRLLPSVRQFGWEHPATERTLRTAFEAFAEALAKEPALARMAVRPYSFMTLGQTVWEPGPPFDSVPYNLFACGFRSLRIEPTITIEELRSTLTLMLLDPGRDLPPEDDMAAAFWERGLQHVRYEVADVFAEGDATEREAFYSESDKIEEVAAAASQTHVSRIEAKAMAVSTDRSALRGADARGPMPMALEDVVRAVYASQLDLPSERWSERFVDALVEGYIDAAFCRDAALVLASMRKSAADLIVAGRLPVVVSLWNALTERLGQRISGNDFHKLSGALTNAMFGAEALELALTHIRTHADQFASFEPVLRILSARELTVVLGALRAGPEAALKGALLGYLERVAPGNEVQIGAAAAGLDAELACQLMAL
ncbi:MAG: protein kinase, partial [Polyangiaceae bacterium]